MPRAEIEGGLFEPGKLFFVKNFEGRAQQLSSGYLIDPANRLPTKLRLGAMQIPSKLRLFGF
jgi:hypothetical protein